MIQIIALFMLILVIAFLVAYVIFNPALDSVINGDGEYLILWYNNKENKRVYKILLKLKSYDG